MKRTDLPGMTSADVIAGINTGVQIADATLPFIEEIIQKIQDAGTSTDLRTPHGKRVHIEQLEALAKVEVEKQKLYDKYFQQLIDKQIITE